MKKLLSRIVSFLTAAVMSVSAAVIPVSAEKIPDNEAIRFVDSLGAGWNLGNTFDAADEPQYTKSNDLVYETLWCGVKTTRELIKSLKKMGFDTIRIPVSWHNHVDAEYNIKNVWMDRVKEVVDWSLDADLKVIINMHHDNYKGYYYPTSAELATSTKYVKAVWKQICSKFKDYDERLIFESANEPRLKDTQYEWYYPAWSIPNEVKDSLDCVNKLNQTFVDTVRAGGGKNKTRYLLVGGYDTSENETGILSKSFVMPTDTVKNRLIADVHYYCINLSFQKSNFDKIYNSFTAKGIPVIMSEYGLRKNYEEGYYLHDDTEKSAQKLAEIVSYCRGLGISTIFWDNNSGSAGKIGFKIVDRVNAKADIPDIVKAITQAGKPSFAVNTAAAPTVKASAPTVKATAYKTKVKLSWSKTDGASKYEVYQYKNGKYTKIKTVTGSSVTVKTLKSGKTYKFRVRAYVNGKWTDYSSIVKVKTKK